MSGLSDSNAIVLPVPVAVRFNPVRLHPQAIEAEPGSRGDWYGTPGTLTARAWDGTSGLPANGAQDISAGVGGTGQWSAGTISIGWAVGAGAAITASTLTAVDKFWDDLSVDRRREAARQWDADHDPDLEQDRQSGWDSAARIADLERQITELEVSRATSPSEIVVKRTELARLHQELAHEQRRFTPRDTEGPSAPAAAPETPRAKAGRKAALRDQTVEFLRRHHPTGKPDEVSYDMIRAEMEKAGAGISPSDKTIRQAFIILGGEQAQ